MDSWYHKFMDRHLTHDSGNLTDDGAVPRFALRHGLTRPSGSLCNRQGVGLIASQNSDGV